MSEEHVFLACELRANQKVVQLEDHQSQLAALREELAQTKRTAITEILALNSTLREQAKSLAAMSDRELEIAAEHADGLQQRLADAERRNAGLIELLRSLRTNADPKLFSSGQLAQVDTALNPNPEAASHDE